MSMAAMAAIAVDDVWIETSAGRLFARVWSPAASAGATRGVTGDACPIVLLHDSLGCVEFWRDFPHRLSAACGRTVIAYDRLGFGRSDARHDTLTPEFVAEEARTGFADVLRHFAVNKFIVFGHSIGGGMAVHCAAAFNDRCAGVISESAQAFIEDRTLLGIRQAKTQYADSNQLARLARYHGDKTAWVLSAWIDSWLNPAFASWSLIAVLPAVTCSVLAIHGADDEFGSAKHPEIIARLCSGPGRAEIVADTRHVPHHEKPERIAEMTRAFVGRLDQAGGAKSL